MTNIFFNTRYGGRELRFGWVIMIAVAACAALIGGIIAVCIIVGAHVSHAECTAWGHDTGRPVRFVKYEVGSYACLTPNPSQPGTWIENTQLVGVR